MNEIGIETLAEHRGKGYAEIVSTEFIKQCLKNGQVPVWSCRLENTGSYRLALKLGFRETVRVPFYRLCEKGKLP
jgi:predicted GNAT family acetyltransferase